MKLQYGCAEIVGKEITALFGGIHNTSLTNQLEQWNDSIREVEILRKDKSILLGSMSLSKIAVTDGYFYSAIVRDATGIQEERERYVQILGQAVDAVVSIDENNCVTFFNTAAEHLFGYSRAEVLGQNVKMLVPEAIRPNHDQYVNANRTTGVNKIVGKTRDVEITQKDGNKIWGQLSVSKIYLSDKMIYTGFLKNTNKEHINRNNTNVAMNEVLSSSNQISQIVTVLNDIAAQTKLLSLNIGIEAANAGDSARGIAVLADEFQKLSELSTESASKIEELITDTKTRIANLDKSFRHQE